MVQEDESVRRFKFELKSRRKHHPERLIQVALGCDGSTPDGRCGADATRVILFDWQRQKDIPIVVCDEEDHLKEHLEGQPDFPSIVADGATNIRIISVKDFLALDLKDN